MRTSSLLSLFLVLSTLGFAPVALAKDWKSGEIVSRDLFKYGAFETRLKAAKGSGSITGFLVIVPDAGGSSAWQEMAFEFFGKSDGMQYQTQIIVPGPPENDVGQLPRSQNMKQHTSDTSFFDNFHTIRMEWTPKRLAFYYDGNLVREETDSGKYGQLMDASKAEPMNIRTTLWAGFSDWSGQVDSSNPPTSATLDYIKYESWDSAAGKFVPAWNDEFNTFDSARWQKADWTFPFSVNDFSPANVNAENGNLVIKFTGNGQAASAGK